MQRYDPLSGPRREIYQHFRSFAYPWTTLSGPIRADSDRLHRDGGLFGNLLWGALHAVNAIPQLRRRIRVEGGQDVVVEHDTLDATCTVARPDGTFAFTHFPWNPDRRRFLATLRERVAAGRAQPGLLPAPDEMARLGDALTYVSCVPWMEVTSVQHAMGGDPLDCVPRVLWGRVPETGPLTVSLTVHHALADGRHIAAFFAAFQEALEP